MTVTWTSGYDIDEGLLLNGVPKEKSKHTLLEKVVFTMLILNRLIENRLRNKCDDIFVNKYNYSKTVLQKPP